MPRLEFSSLTLLLAQMAVIIVLSRVVAIVTRRLGQPRVIAEILAGIMLGPSLLGLVSHDAMVTLFPDSSLGQLKLLSQFGLIFFMFLVGLEFDLGVLRGRAKATLAISHGSIAVPFVLGAGLGVLLEPPAGITRIAFCLFCGIALSITAFPVLARILNEKKMMQTRVGSIAIAAAAIDDVTAWCLLAFVVAIARAQGVTQAVWTCGLTAAFLGVMIFIVRPLLKRVRNTDLQILVSFVGLLATAGVAELIGIHALFGAFFFGVMVPRHDELPQRLTKKLESVSTMVLLPLFFAFSGLRTQLGLLHTAGDWALTAGIIALATVGKFGAATATARITGSTWKDATAVGVLMNTRGLMELVVLNIGLDLGVISPELFTMMVLMALVTTAATSPLLNLIGVERDAPAPAGAVTAR